MNKPLVLLSAAAVIMAGLWFVSSLEPPDKQQPAVPDRTDRDADPAEQNSAPAPPGRFGGSLKPAPPTVRPTRPEDVPATALRALLDQLTAALASHDSDTIETLLVACVAEDPEKTAAYLESASLGEARERILTRLAQHWTAQTPRAALQWALQRADASERESLAGSVYLKWAEVNPRDAVAAAQEGDSLDITRNDVMRNLVAQWADKNLPSATAWAKAQPPSGLRDELIQQVAIKQAEALPSEAARLVVQEIPPGVRQNEAIIAVLHQWAQHDLPGAKAWVARFPSNTDMGHEVRWELKDFEKDAATVSPLR